MDDIFYEYANLAENTLNSDVTLGIAGVWINWFLSIIYALIVILVLAYISIKFVSKTKGLSSANSNIKVMESISIGYQSVIQLIKIGDKYILVGVSKEKITYLTEIDEQHLVFSKDDTAVDKISFDKYLKNLLGKNGSNHVD